MERGMEMVNLLGTMAKHLKENGRMARNTEMEYGNHPKEITTKVNG